ncbi:MAG: phosphotransferase [Chlamydiales bacterium]|nr:phosphotransferase [Chlamydiales bacterium]NCF71029.1 phosphotransferase [Chlamydiales bacterium]
MSTTLSLAPHFVSLENAAADSLKVLLKEAWGISSCSQFHLNKLNNPSHSQVIFFESQEQQFILKKHLNLGQRHFLVIDAVQNYGKSQGIKLPTFLPTLKGQSSYKKQGSLYSLQRFDEGRLFRPTVEDVSLVAKELVLFHSTFGTSSWQNYVQEQKMPPYPYSSGLYHYLKSALLSTKFATKSLIHAIEELDHLSSDFKLDFKGFEKTVGHFDIHAKNLLFDQKNGQLSLMLDLDLLRYDYKAKDIALAMLKLCSHEGSLSKELLSSFISTYSEQQVLSKDEWKILGDLIYDESKNKVLHLLHARVFRGELEAEKEVIKQVEFAKKGMLLNSLIQSIQKG